MTRLCASGLNWKIEKTAQLIGIAQNISKGIFVEYLDKPVAPFQGDILENAVSDEGVTDPFTPDDFKGRFGVANQIAEKNRGRVHGQPHSAALAANSFDIAQLGKMP